MIVRKSPANFLWDLSRRNYFPKTAFGSYLSIRLMSAETKAQKRSENRDFQIPLVLLVPSTKFRKILNQAHVVSTYIHY